MCSICALTCCQLAKKQLKQQQQQEDEEEKCVLRKFFDKSQTSFRAHRAAGAFDARQRQL